MHVMANGGGIQSVYNNNILSSGCWCTCRRFLRCWSWLWSNSLFLISPLSSSNRSTAFSWPKTELSRSLFTWSKLKRSWSCTLFLSNFYKEQNKTKEERAHSITSKRTKHQHWIKVPRWRQKSLQMLKYNMIISTTDCSINCICNLFFPQNKV